MFLDSYLGIIDSNVKKVVPPSDISAVEEDAVVADGTKSDEKQDNEPEPQENEDLLCRNVGGKDAHVLCYLKYGKYQHVGAMMIFD